MCAPAAGASGRARWHMVALHPLLSLPLHALYTLAKGLHGLQTGPRLWNEVSTPRSSWGGTLASGCAAANVLSGFAQAGACCECPVRSGRFRTTHAAVMSACQAPCCWSPCPLALAQRQAQAGLVQKTGCDKCPSPCSLHPLPVCSDLPKAHRVARAPPSHPPDIAAGHEAPSPRARVGAPPRVPLTSIFNVVTTQLVLHHHQA